MLLLQDTKGGKYGGDGKVQTQLALEGVMSALLPPPRHEEELGLAAEVALPQRCLKPVLTRHGQHRLRRRLLPRLQHNNPQVRAR